MNKSVLRIALVAAIAPLVWCQTSGAKKVLRWWAPADYTWKQMEAKFESENKGVDIQVMSGSMDKLYSMIIAGMMPDIWGPWDSPGIMADVTRGWVSDLDAFIRRDAAEIALNDFFPGTLRQFKINGKQFSLPSFGYADYYFYNTTYYAEAGLTPPPVSSNDKSWTWEKMVSNSVKLAKRDASGRTTRTGVTISTELTHSPTWLHIWGAEMYGEAALKSSIPNKTYFDTPQMVKALTMAWELVHAQKVAGTGFNDFTERKSGSSIQWGWMIKNFMRSTNLSFAIAPLPLGETRGGVLWPDGWRISKVCKNKELAWKFIKFLLTPANLRLQVSDPKSAYLGTPTGRKTVFNEVWAREVSAKTGMTPSDVATIHQQADREGVLNEVNSICLHRDLCPKNIDPIMVELFANKISPKDAAVKMQKTADKVLPVLTARWLRDKKDK